MSLPACCGVLYILLSAPLLLGGRAAIAQAAGVQATAISGLNIVDATTTDDAALQALQACHRPHAAAAVPSARTPMSCCLAAGRLGDQLRRLQTVSLLLGNTTNYTGPAAQATASIEAVNLAAPYAALTAAGAADALTAALQLLDADYVPQSLQVGRCRRFLRSCDATSCVAVLPRV